MLLGQPSSDLGDGPGMAGSSAGTSLTGTRRINSTLSILALSDLNPSMLHDTHLAALPANRRAPVAVLAAVAILVTACGGEDSPGEAGRTAVHRAAPDFQGVNLLLITIDTLRADRVGAYGDDQAETPRLDQLAREGVLFENAYSHVPLTLPSHGTMFTGRLPFEHGVRTNGSYFLQEDEITLAEVLRDRGYRTGATVATYILSSKFGLAQGFDHYDDALGSGELIRGFSSDATADQVAADYESWLSDGVTAPFFSWVHFYDPPPALPAAAPSR